MQLKVCLKDNEEEEEDKSNSLTVLKNCMLRQKGKAQDQDEQRGLSLP